MLTTRLGLEFQANPTGSAAALWIDGAEPAVWLRELAEAGLANPGVRLLPLCEPTAERRLIGVVAVPGAGTSLLKVRETPRLRLWQCRASCLYFPLAAVLAPPVADAELLDQLPDIVESLYAWHPRAGLVRVEQAEVLTVADLLAPPVRRDSRWDLAEPGVAVRQQIVTVEPDAATMVQNLLEGGRDGIGTESDDLSGLPPAPDESSPGAKERLHRAFGKPLAGLMRWLGGGAKKPPAGKTGQPQSGQAAGAGAAGGGTGAGVGGGLSGNLALRLMRWAAGALSERRNREIHRLLKMLQDEPDRGLRFAPPMASGEGEAHRGLAPPSSWLTEHGLDFDLNLSGGGGAADIWSIDTDLQSRLLIRYRELADREMRLGRFRRAAWILASLLGDIRGSAGALERGRFYREAAVLYRDRLKEPLEAAACLERGGLLSEAAAMYELYRQFEQAGDLYVWLEQPEEARRLWLMAADDLEQRQEWIKAASLREKKLEEPEQAVECLRRGWTHSAQPVRCLTELFDLFARQGMGDRAPGEIRRLRAGLRSGARPAFCEALTDVALTTPLAELRPLAADAVRREVACGLEPVAQEGEQNKTAIPEISAVQRMLAALKRLTPQDRLLGRDCTRFTSLARRQAAGSRTRSADHPLHEAAASRQLKCIDEIALPASVWWTSALGTAAGCVVGGWQGSRLRLEVFPWTGGRTAPRPTGLSWDTTRMQSGEVLLAGSPTVLRQLAVAIPGSTDRLERQRWNLERPSGAIDVGTPVGLAEGAISLAWSGGEQLWSAVLNNRELSLQHLDADGRQLESFTLWTQQDYDAPQNNITLTAADLDSALNGPDAIPVIPSAARKRRFEGADGTAGTVVYLGIGERLFAWTGERLLPLAQFDSRIRRVVTSGNLSRGRALVGLEQGAAVYWDDKWDDERIVRFANDMVQPEVCCTWSGQIVAACRGGIEVYSARQGQLKLEAGLEDAALDPLQIVPAREPARFAILTADGKLQLYAVR